MYLGNSVPKQKKKKDCIKLCGFLRLFILIKKK